MKGNHRQKFRFAIAKPEMREVFVEFCQSGHYEKSTLFGHTANRHFKACDRIAMLWIFTIQ
jgi:hypothetical protein